MNESRKFSLEVTDADLMLLIGALINYQEAILTTKKSNDPHGDVLDLEHVAKLLDYLRVFLPESDEAQPESD